MVLMVAAQVAVLLPAGGTLARGNSDPCRGLRGVTLPTDDAEALTRLQRRIIRCAAHVHETGFGTEDKAQCVPFAYALMDRLRPPEMRYSSGGTTAGEYFLRLDSLGHASEPDGNRRPKKQKRPLFVWWKEGLTQGHVAVYIGGDLFVDSQAAFLVAKHDLSVKKPKLVAWNLQTPNRQVAFSRYIHQPWPRRSPVGPDGYSSARVNGGSCRICVQ